MTKPLHFAHKALLKGPDTWLARACAAAALTGLSMLPLKSHAVEEPTFTVQRTLDGIELREFAPYTVAEVLVVADVNDAGNRAFPIMAGYIFGKNKGERKMAMTAPVTQTPPLAVIWCSLFCPRASPRPTPRSPLTRRSCCAMYQPSA